MEVFERLTRHLPEDVGTFRSRNPHAFLVRRPISLVQRDKPIPIEEIEYRTVSVAEGTDGIPPWEWWIAPLQKRPGNPFPDHLSVGRTTNCDIVMRFRYVSKLHARFHMKEKMPVSIEDLGSSNGTGVNGRRLHPSQKMEIRPGDRITIGSLAVELMTPEDFYFVLRRRVLHSASPPPRSNMG